MYTISKEIQFDAGHRVPLHTSKCKNPHGHRYRVVAFLEGELITSGPETGMVRDFSHVKQALTEFVHDVFDHGFVNCRLRNFRSVLGRQHNRIDFDRLTVDVAEGHLRLGIWT